MAWAILLGCGMAGQAAAAAKDPPGSEHRDVLVQGHLMHFELSRGSNPDRVILLEAGATLSSTEWTEVMRRLRSRTNATIIAYDRAGMGRSAPLRTRYDVRQEVSRLHDALRQLGLAREMVLVGHSYGGFLIQLYANLYPREVAGMVYVEAVTVSGLGGVAGATLFRNAISDAIRAGTNQFSDPRLAEGYVRTMKTLMRNPPPCGIPVAVITRGPRDMAITDPLLQRWRDGHAALAATTGGTLIHAARSGHVVPVDDPDLVADAILGVNDRAGRARADPRKCALPNG
ncbi:alpha/beta fold hydrolase [Sphingomonas hengshuiensis]|uniref:AB hydrolase-1 domain-containing protein n=1 Tax=Sphingomonas hengshuiensis TaxID=1609977 RepID=A0A7U4LE83_9SPHN|nr:alpha/beta hydrolase [Sphingomonas hengshuiensis]AJP71202.1 hypothetical protein TS85_04320 [Sphingomonas hengshuiensis]